MVIKKACKRKKKEQTSPSPGAESMSNYRPSSKIKRRKGPLPLRPKQFAKALYYDYINQFEKVTIKGAHDRRIDKFDELQRHLRRKGRSHTQRDIYKHISVKSRRNASTEKQLLKQTASLKGRGCPSTYAHEEMTRRMRHSLHRIDTMHRRHMFGMRRPASSPSKATKKKTPRKMKFKKTNVDLAKVGIIQTQLCAMCCVRFRKENLTGKVTRKAIYDTRMLRKAVRTAKKQLRTSFMEYERGPHYIFREFGSAPMDESVRQMENSTERKLHRNMMTYEQFFRGCKVLFKLEFEEKVKEELLTWLDRDRDGDIHLQEFLLLMEESYNNDKKKRRKKRAEASDGGEANLYRQARYVQKDLERLDSTQHEMQKLPYRLYHTLYEFVDVCRMCSHIFGGDFAEKAEEEEKNPDEWHEGRPIPVSMRSRHQPRLLRREMKKIFMSWKERKLIAPFETAEEHSETPIHVLSFDMVPTKLSHKKRPPLTLSTRIKSPPASPISSIARSKMSDADEREVFESELEKKKLALIYREWRASGKDVDDWMNSDAFNAAEEKAHEQAGLGEFVDFADVEARSKFIINGRDDEMDAHGQVSHNVAPAVWGVIN